MTTKKKDYDPAYKPRKCRHCKLTFVPKVGMKGNRLNAENQKFCCKKCKDNYHRNGGMNWERFMERVDANVRKIVRDEFSRQMDRIVEETRHALLTPLVADKPLPQSQLTSQEAA